MTSDKDEWHDTEDFTTGQLVRRSDGRFVKWHRVYARQQFKFRALSPTEVGPRYTETDIADSRYKPGAAARFDKLLTQEINRRVPVEQYLLDCANGKRELPDRDKCRELAQKLGVADEDRR